MYCEMITTIMLVNTFMTLHGYLCVSVMRTFTIYSLSNFQVLKEMVFLTFIYNMPCGPKRTD